MIIDDMLTNREMLADILEDHFEVTKAESGMQALRMLKANPEEFVVVLLDLIMPEVDGFAVLEFMKKQKWLKRTGVVVITGENSREAEMRCLELGASDFVQKPFEPAIVRHRVTNVVELFSYKRAMEHKVKKQTETLQKQYNLLKLQSERIKASYERIIDIIGELVEFRDTESGKHIRHVRNFTTILAKEVQKEYPEYKLSDEDIERISSASVLHDIGKIAIPDHILSKPGKLTNDEYELMKSHASRGSELLQQIQDVWDKDFEKTSYEICRYHHERYDGRGYPDGLKGEEIPLAAQIVSVADVYDALVSERVYKAAYTPQQAFHMIITGECGVFSPKILECFRNVQKDFEALAAKEGTQEE